MATGRLREALARFRFEFAVAGGLYALMFVVGLAAFVKFGLGLEDVGYQSQSSFAFDSSEFSFVGVLGNNLFTMTVSTLGGLAAGVPTVLNTLFNGFIMGILSGVVVTADEPVVAAATLVPHSVIEVPAFLVAAAVGFKLPRKLIRYLVGKQSYILDQRTLYDMVYGAVFVAVLTVCAALVEAYVTPRIAARVAGA